MCRVESRTTGRPMFWIAPPTDRAGTQSYTTPTSQPVLEVPPRYSAAAGFAAALYRGGTSSTGWDVGVVYDWVPALSVGGAIQNIGRPVVRDSTLHITYVPSATLRLAGRRVVVSALSRVTTDGVAGYALGLGGTLRAETSFPIGLLARLDTDRSLRRTGLAFGFSLGGEDAAGLIATAPGDAHGIDGLSVYGVSTRRLTSARRSGP